MNYLLFRALVNSETLSFLLPDDVINLKDCSSSHAHEVKYRNEVGKAASAFATPTHFLLWVDGGQADSHHEKFGIRPQLRAWRTSIAATSIFMEMTGSWFLLLSSGGGHFQDVVASAPDFYSVPP